MSQEPDYRRKKWNIIVPYRFDELSDFALQQAVTFCKSFGSGLILLKVNPQDGEKVRMQQLVTGLHASHGIRTEAYTPDGDFLNMLAALSRRSEAIMIVLGHNGKETSTGWNLRTCLRKMKNSRTPFLMVPASLHHGSLSEVLLPLGYQKQEKEKILWGSYFGRICKSNISVAVPLVSDQYFKSGIRGNLSALEKLYHNADVKYCVLELNANIHQAAQVAVEKAVEIKAGVLITLTTLHRDVFDFFGGTDEYRLIKMAGNIPVLCINPRDDLYVLCN